MRNKFGSIKTPPLSQIIAVATAEFKDSALCSFVFFAKPGIVTSIHNFFPSFSDIPCDLISNN
jgi:hypothetical protein